MCYTNKNYQKKKELKDDVAKGYRVSLRQDVLSGRVPPDGIAYVEGPHPPAAHSWYAMVKVKNGLVVKVLR